MFILPKKLYEPLMFRNILFCLQNKQLLPIKQTHILFTKQTITSYQANTHCLQNKQLLPIKQTHILFTKKDVNAPLDVPAVATEVGAASSKASKSILYWQMLGCILEMV